MALAIDLTPYVDKTSVQTLSGPKTLTAPVLSVPVIADFTGAGHTHASTAQGGTLSGYEASGAVATHAALTATHGVSGAIVGTTDSQTLSSKTLTAPIIATISNTGTLTLPTSTDTLVGRATTDTLTNKTLTTPTIGSFTNATHTHANAAGGGQIDHTTALTNIGSNTHAQIDTHLAATAAHGATGAVVGTTGSQSIASKTLDNTNTVTLKDTLFTLQDDGDATKQVQFQLSGITTGNTRTLTVPDSSDTLVLLTATQTLTNKTLTTPTIGSFVNATHDHTNSAGGGTLSGTLLATGATTGATSQAQTFTNGVVTGILAPGSNSTTAIGFYQADKTTAVLQIDTTNLVTTHTRAGVGVTSADGIVLTNTTAAAVGAQQFSPRLRLTGQGWKTTATAASQTVDWIFENQPVQGTTNPTSNLVISSQVNGAGYTSRFAMTSAGLIASNLIFTDNTYDIGALGANRPRAIYTAAQITIGSGFGLQFGSGSFIFPISDGVIKLQNAAGTDYGRLILGPATSSFPALKRSTTEIQVRLGDDSAYGSLRTGNFGMGGTSPAGAQTVTGSRGGNAALASLLTGLATLGIVVDSSSA